MATLKRAGSVATCVLLFLGLSVSAAVPPAEYRVKAVFLFNFAQFVDWPPDAFTAPGQPFVIGVLGKDPFGAELDSAVRRERLAKDAVVLAEDAWPAIGEPLGQDRRALDVREEQRDGARRQLHSGERLPPT